MYKNLLIQRVMRTNLVSQIAVAIVAAVALALLSIDAAKSVMILGELFVQALKSVAPVLVFFLVSSAIANQSLSHAVTMRSIIGLYLLGTVSAAFIAVVISLWFPAALVLNITDLSLNPPQGIAQVLNTLLFRLVDNPINALSSGNFIGILVWGLALGYGLRHSSNTTKHTLADIADAVSYIVKLLIRLAPLGIFGLVAGNIATFGLSALNGYIHVLLVLLVCMLLVALVVNPIYFMVCH